ncbi:MAG TPA: universal stress protein [Candidatus Eisenbacteria bacterium]|nr:universal stress protein [Candidatus Eisenbacteria bacterium]
MKILIALDASPHSEQALQFVTRMRWPAGSRVIVLSVLQPVAHAVSMPYDPTPIDVDVLAEQRRQLEELVSDAESRLRECGFSTEGRVLSGDPRETLVQEALATHADLIVAGSHGRTGIAKLMIGSVSSHLVTHAPCSVLVVKTAAAAGPSGTTRRA